MAERAIVKDPIFLARKSRNANAGDCTIARDLLDTISAHRGDCVGLAANMIGEAVRIIVFDNEGIAAVMFNPEIVKAEEPYETEEGCLSHSGLRRTKRYNRIKVQYQNEKMQIRLKSFSGWTAQIIQHEIDHCNGILI